MKVASLSALRTGLLYPQEIFLVLISFRGWVDHSAAGRNMSMKNSTDTIGNRSRDLPICIAVPQPLRHQLRAPPKNVHLRKLSNSSHLSILAYTFLKWTIEFNSTSHCLNYKNGPNPNSSTQPSLFPLSKTSRFPQQSADEGKVSSI
jgi:hypothetical protein